MTPDRGKSAKEVRAILALCLFGALFAAGCTPTVKVETPKEPITINLNVKLDAEVRLKLEREAEQDVETKPIF